MFYLRIYFWVEAAIEVCDVYLKVPGAPSIIRINATLREDGDGDNLQEANTGQVQNLNEIASCL